MATTSTPGWSQTVMRWRIASTVVLMFHLNSRQSVPVGGFGLLDSHRLGITETRPRPITAQAVRSKAISIARVKKYIMSLIRVGIVPRELILKKENAGFVRKPRLVARVGENRKAPRLDWCGRLPYGRVPLSIDCRAVSFNAVVFSYTKDSLS